MTLYYFRIQNTSGGEVADLSTDLANHDAAWTELANVCGDLVRDATRSLRPNAHWQLELLDVAKKPLFRIRVVAESFGSDWRDNVTPALIVMFWRWQRLESGR